MPTLPAWYWPEEPEDPTLALRYELIAFLAPTEAARILVPQGWVGISPLSGPSLDHDALTPCAWFVEDPEHRSEGSDLRIGTVPRRHEQEAIEVIARLAGRDDMVVQHFRERDPEDYEAMGHNDDHSAIYRIVGRQGHWLCAIGRLPRDRWEAMREQLHEAMISLRTHPEWASPLR